jgi:hypothetical protein
MTLSGNGSSPPLRQPHIESWTKRRRGMRDRSGLASVVGHRRTLLEMQEGRSWSITPVRRSSRFVCWSICSKNDGEILWKARSSCTTTKAVHGTKTTSRRQLWWTASSNSGFMLERDSALIQGRLPDLARLSRGNDRHYKNRQFHSPTLPSVQIPRYKEGEDDCHNICRTRFWHPVTCLGKQLECDVVG